MNDAVFNTLMSVALMCGQHLMGGGSLDGDMLPNGGLFNPGFEKCIDIVTSYRTERTRRAQAQVDKNLQDDKNRVANAVAALKGKEFKPEAPTTLPRPLWGSSCTVPTIGTLE